MRALIFAAGLGKRMRPLTDSTAKPMLQVGGKALIVWHLEKLAALGVVDIVINTSWLAEQFPAQLGDGQHWGIRLHYVNEGDTPLVACSMHYRCWEMLRLLHSMAISGPIMTLPACHLNRPEKRIW